MIDWFFFAAIGGIFMLWIALTTVLMRRIKINDHIIREIIQAVRVLDLEMGEIQDALRRLKGERTFIETERTNSSGKAEDRVTS